MEIRIEGLSSELVSSAEAGAWLGVGDDFFEKLAEQESSWMQPAKLSPKIKRWRAVDVWVLRHIITHRAMFNAAIESAAKKS